MAGSTPLRLAENRSWSAKSNPLTLGGQCPITGTNRLEFARHINSRHNPTRRSKWRSANH